MVWSRNSILVALVVHFSDSITANGTLFCKFLNLTDHGFEAEVHVMSEESRTTLGSGRLENETENESQSKDLDPEYKLPKRASLVIVILANTLLQVRTFLTQWTNSQIV